MFTAKKPLMGILGCGIVPMSQKSQMTILCFPKFSHAYLKMTVVSSSSTFPNKATKQFLIVGLGNHDRLHTRHSVGMQVVEHVAERFKTSRWHQFMHQCAGYVSQGQIGNTGVKLILLKPKMPMNVNGTSVAKTARYFGVPSENIMLVHDDIDKKLGKIIVKEGGSANGHNGVRSVINSLGADMMSRFKIGVDRPSTKSEVAEYVLSDFHASEQKTVTRVIDECVEKVIDKLEEQSGINLTDDDLDLHFSGGT